MGAGGGVIGAAIGGLSPAFYHHCKNDNGAKIRATYKKRWHWIYGPFFMGLGIPAYARLRLVWWMPKIARRDVVG